MAGIVQDCRTASLPIGQALCMRLKQAPRAAGPTPRPHFIRVWWIRLGHGRSSSIICGFDVLIPGCKGLVTDAYDM